MTLRLYFPIAGMKHPEAWLKKSYDHASIDAYIHGAKNISIEALSREAELDIQLTEEKIEIKNSLGFSMSAEFEKITFGNINGFLLTR
ncbi:hypothetical protein BJP27_12380 [Pseudomonas oryzihabitans]|nr:hypothetical protein BJP27_12380 [Pseudomonas psychrotolerans]